jgi:4-coumarate--CoA ligase
MNDPEATVRTIDKDGWMHTDDIAFIDEVEEVFMQDRLKELINVKGSQVPPVELEALLVSHLSIADWVLLVRQTSLQENFRVAFMVRIQDAAVTEADVKEFIPSHHLLFI